MTLLVHANSLIISLLVVLFTEISVSTISWNLAPIKFEHIYQGKNLFLVDTLGYDHHNLDKILHDIRSWLNTRPVFCLLVCRRSHLSLISGPRRKPSSRNYLSSKNYGVFSHNVRVIPRLSNLNQLSRSLNTWLRRERLGILKILKVMKDLGTNGVNHQ